jgi:hypothetical protein
MDIEGYCQLLLELLKGYTPSRPFTVRSDLHAHISLSMVRKASHVLSGIEFTVGCSHTKRTYIATKLRF